MDTKDVKYTGKKTIFKKKPLGTDSMGIQKTMYFSDYLADGTGQLVLNIMSGLVGQLTYFYTDKVGLAAASIATVLFVAKIIDAFAQLIMGNIMDKGRSPKGICRPWFLRMAIPAFIFTVALFAVPDSFSTNAKLIFMMLTSTILTAVVYTAIAIPYSSIMALRTKSQEERTKMGTFRAALGYISGMVIAITIIPITNLLGGDKKAWIILAVIFGIIETLCLLFLYAKSREASNPDEVLSDTEKEDVPLKKGLSILFRNKYWVIMLIVQFCIQVAYGISGSSGVYYAKWVLGNDNLVAVLGLSGMIPTLIGFMIITPMVKKFGVTNTMKISAAIVIICNFIRVFMPASLMATVILGAIATLGTIPPMALVTVMTNNCVDYNEWKSGYRLLGMTNSATGFGGQVGSGIGASLVGWILAIGAYNPSATVQPTSAIYAIYTFSIYLPIIIQVIVLFCLTKYDLEGKYPQIIQELNERKQTNVE